MRANQSKPESILKAEGLDQSRLNISERSRRSRLPWRGQFSPELVEYFMETVCSNSSNFYDPFCGSGTVLYESLQRGHAAAGLEINPAAWHLAVLSRFTSLGLDEQQHVLRTLKGLINRCSSSGSLFDGSNHSAREMVSKEQEPIFTRLAIAAAIILGMGNNSEMNAAALAKGGFAVIGLLSELEKRRAYATCHLNDARCSPIATASIDAVITSPPYINVFNYHQNYRPAAELLGWQPLQAAVSEIGANRKHRMNRFLTVVQYCLDMQSSLADMARVMKPDAPLVIVLGRTSNVLGTSFLNGSIIRDLLRNTECFEETQQAERVFTNRFGEKIYEDILVWRRTGHHICNPTESATQVGVDALKRGLTEVPSKNRPALEAAIEKSNEIKPSPLLKVSIPAHFSDAF